MGYTKLSKEISYALRHAPWEYELELDSEGFVPVDQLLTAISEEKYGRPIIKSDLEYIIENSDKKGMRSMTVKSGLYMGIQRQCI